MEDRKAKILVVDDEPDIVDTLKEYLSGKGYEVLGALSGEEALGMLGRENADLILMDIMMPGLKGTDVARIVKQKYPNIKVIILTGYPQETEDLVKNNMLEGIFAKPIKMQELYTKLSAVIGRPDEQSELKRGIKARVLLIKAKLLFLEDSSETYSYLSSHFKELANRGEDYECELARTQDEIMEKMVSFAPDLLIVNTALINKCGADILAKMLENKLSPTEIIVYNINDIVKSNNAESERLAKAVEAYCFKNGLIEVKWVEI